MRHVRGFTLIESVLVMSLTTTLFFVGALVVTPLLDSWSQVSARTESLRRVDYALDRLVYEVAQLRNETSVEIATASQLRFIDVNDQQIDYFLNGNLLTRNGNILARNIQSLVFNYWDSNDNLLATPQVAPANTDIWRIGVELSVLTDDQLVTLRSQFHPRNLPRT